MNSPKSYLIVGQGIAGSLLAWHLIDAGHTVNIIDNNHHESSSMVSAGIINPITGQRLALTPQFDCFYKEAMRTYSAIGKVLGQDFFISKPIVRVLRSEEELRRCHHLQTLNDAKPYIESIISPGYYGTSLHDPFGTLTIAQGGYVQTHLLLTALRQFYLDKKMLISEKLDYNDVQADEDRVQWKDKRFDTIIFCEGFKARQNPWFKTLPFNFAKGEILKIAFESASLPDAIICQQQWCLPTSDGAYLAGSTYDRDNINTASTPEGQLSIIKGLNDFIPSKVHIIKSHAGVRPVMLNQKPIIGMHPTTPWVGIFNGFASKGMLWAPYYAQAFANNPTTPLK